MRHAFAASVLLAATDSNAGSWDVTLSSANGGSQTEIRWLFQDYTHTWEGTGPKFSALAALGGPTYNISGTAAFDTAPSPSTFSGITTGITYTNLRTSATVPVDAIGFFVSVVDGVTSANILFRTRAGLTVESGDIIAVGGATDGVIVLDVAFTAFNNGTWTAGNNTLQVGPAAIPEPSTCGLILGGLALAGAAVRRRRAKRA